MYVLLDCASSMTRSCWSDCIDGRPRGDGLEGSKVNKSDWLLWNPGVGVRLPDGLYRGESERCGSKADCDFDDTEETKFSVLDRDAWMFFVRTSRTSLKLAPTSASFPWSITTT